ncbi:MAG: hypothetical protein JST11_25505 [Acidobacteria bacterium]|nr:hypothetical protein [Acidobacteriota bacterium]
MKPLLLFFLAAALAAQPTITSDNAPPVVLQGTTHSFTATCRGTCQWSLTPGSVGTIDQSGTFQAPTRVVVNSSIAGCQLFTPDHGNNTRIDSLPARPESSAWDSLLLKPGRPIILGGDFPWNLMDSGTAAYGMTFLYTPANNSPPKPPYQVVPLPPMKLQGNYYYTGGSDHHYIGVRPDTCAITELYRYGGAPFPYGGTASSGVRYNSMTTALPSFWGGATDAAGTYLLSNILRVTEVLKAIGDGSNVVKHPIRITLLNYSQLGSATPEWPASAVAVNASGVIPYGGRFRLKESGCIATGLLDANCNYTGTNPATLVILNTLKQYGLMVADGGASLDTSMDTDAAPPQLRDAVLKEIPGMGMNLVRNLEAVNESVLAPANANAVDGGLINPGAAAAIPGFALPQFAEVVVTDSFNGSTAKIRVALQGAALDVESASYNFQAGAAAYQIPYHISGVSDTSVTWSMSPPLGSLDPATGAYTPPATLSSPAATTLTVKSNQDASLVAQTRVVVMPDGVLGLLTSAPGDYTDTKGQKWWAVSELSDYPVASPGLFYPPTVYNDGPVSGPDSYLYSYSLHPRNDLGIELRVPNGKYKITAKLASSNYHYLEHLESQGKIIYNDLDPGALAGGVPNQPVDLQMPALVTDGVLRVYARRRDQYGGVGGESVTRLPAILIEPDPNAAPHLTINPTPDVLTTGQTQQFYCVGWYTDNSCTWTLTSGPGSITPAGLYAAPAVGYDPSVPVTVTATSTTDATVTASITFNLAFGPMAITPVKPTVDRGLQVRFRTQINGTDYANVTWSLSPEVGTIDASGNYTAPETVSADTQVTVTATSTDSHAHSGSTVLTVRKTMPAIHIAPGMDYPSTVTDSAGNIWTPGKEYFTCTGGSCYPGPAAVHDQPLSTASSTYPPNVEVSSRTKLIWDGVQRGSAYVDPPQGDFQYLFQVPNGSYRVFLAFDSNGAYTVPNGDKQDVWINGVKWLSGWDTVVNCGVNIACSPPGYSLSVTNHQILIHFKGAYRGPVAGARGGVPAITAIQIYDADNVPASLQPKQPVCDAGSPQSFRAGYPAQLDGSRSLARDGGEGLQYFWQQLSGPSSARWSSRSAAQPTISMLTSGSYAFQLTVTDGCNQSSTCTVKHGAVATDDNGVVITGQPAVDALLGPLVRLGANPWPWFDDRNKAAAVLQAAGMEANYPAWWDAAGPGTVATLSGSTTITGSNTTFTTTFCQGPGSPTLPKSGAVIAVWYDTGIAGQTGRRMSGVTGCADDAHLTVDDAWDSSVTPAASGLSYAAADNTTNFAANWGWGGADSPGNYYDNVAAYYALYYRTGIDDYLISARDLADRVWRSPMIDRGTSQIAGHSSSYGYVARSISALGLVLRAVELQGTSMDMWPGLHHLWDTYMGYMRGADSNAAPGLTDTREEAYHLAMLSYCALLDPDPSYQSNCSSAIANSFGSLWSPSRAPDGSWPQLFYGQSSWDTTTSVSLTNGSTVVTGNGTSWTADGYPATIWFTNTPSPRPSNNLAGDSSVYTANFVDSTHLTLSQPYQGMTGVHGWASTPGAAMIGWGVQPAQMGLLASAFDLAAKAINTTYPAQAAMARDYSATAANWLRSYGYWSQAKGLYVAVGGVNCQPPISDSNAACTGGQAPGDARALGADALRGMMTAYATSQDSRLKDAVDSLYNAMFAKPGTCPIGSALCVPDGSYVQGLDDGGPMMTAAPPAGAGWFGRFFGFNNLAAWPAYRVGGLQPTAPRKRYIGFSLGQIAGATKARVTVVAPSGTRTQVDCARSPCAVNVDGRQGRHLIQLQYLSNAGAVLAGTEIPM